MKKLIVAVMIAGAVLAGCGQVKPVQSEPVSSTPSAPEESSTTAEEKAPADDEKSDFMWKIEDSGLTSGNTSLYDIDILNSGSRYMDGLYCFTFGPDEYGQIYNQYVAMSNVAPGHTEMGSIYLPFGLYDPEKKNVQINCIREDYKDSAGTIDVPDGDIKKYIYCNYELDGVNSSSNHMMGSADVNNATTSYFTGDITVKVYDKSGSKIYEVSDHIKNLEPGGRTFVTIAPPIENVYQYDYEIGEHTLTDRPQA